MDGNKILMKTPNFLLKQIDASNQCYKPMLQNSEHHLHSIRPRENFIETCQFQESIAIKKAK